MIRPRSLLEAVVWINCDWVEMFLGSTEADGELFRLLKVQLE